MCVFVSQPPARNFDFVWRLLRFSQYELSNDLLHPADSIHHLCHVTRIPCGNHAPYTSSGGYKSPVSNGSLYYNILFLDSDRMTSAPKMKYGALARRGIALIILIVLLLVRLGNSGLKVSKIILGCMSYGNPNWSGSWVLPEEEGIKHIKAA